MKELQRSHQAFLDERPNLSKSPFFAQHAIYRENDELLHVMPDPEELTLWQRAELSGELADILLYLATIANSYGIDLYEAGMRKIEINRERFRPEETYEASKKREGRPLPEVVPPESHEACLKI